MINDTPSLSPPSSGEQYEEFDGEIILRRLSANRRGSNRSAILITAPPVIDNANDEDSQLITSPRPPSAEMANRNDWRESNNRLSVLSEESSLRNDSDYLASGESEFGSARNSIGSSDCEQVRPGNRRLPLTSAVVRARKYSDGDEYDDETEVCSGFEDVGVLFSFTFFLDCACSIFRTLRLLCVCVVVVVVRNVAL